MNTETNGLIAVIAVHGVADQKPGETARAIANLLLREHGPTAEGPSGSQNRASYSAFTDSSLHVAVGPVCVPKDLLVDAASAVKKQTHLHRALKFHPQGDL